MKEKADLTAGGPRTPSRESEEATPSDYSLARTILNALSAHVAILNEDGFIMETNRAWERFASENQIQIRPDTKSVNYLEVCDLASSDTDDGSATVARGIRDVIDGRIEEFALDYPCHSPDQQRWFYMRVTRAPGPGPLRIVVSHENITPLKLAEQRLRQSEKKLSEEKKRLSETVTALKVLLREREADRLEMEKATAAQLQRLVAPLIERLNRQTLKPRARSLVTSLQNRIVEFNRPFLKNLSTLEAVLTPQEFEIAALIRQGHGTKDIAANLNLSPTTVNFHRRSLRRKLGLQNTGTNLRSFLLGI